ncbi:MAG: transposase [Desulfosalsimonadaceae bacterium]
MAKPVNMHHIREWLKTKPVGQAFQPAIHYPEIQSLTKEHLQSIHFFRRRLPHWELRGFPCFVTFRVCFGSEKPLLKSILASLVEESLWFGHGQRYALEAYVIMPDHVHLLIQPINDWGLSKILQGLKGFTAREINKVLGRKGSFWQDENFDHLIRNARDWLDKFDYIHNNPVKAGLVDKPQDYPFSSLVTLYSRGRADWKA